MDHRLPAPPAPPAPPASAPPRAWPSSTAASAAPDSLAPAPCASRLRALRREALACAAAVLLMLLAIAAVEWRAGAPWRMPAAALLMFAGGTAIVLAKLRLYPHARFGAANAVTLMRLGLIAGLAGLALEPVVWRADDGWRWAIVTVATATACLDALDGPLARRAGLAGDWGARFDMESDAAMVLVLSLLVAQQGSVGPWILAAGLMRYAYVAAMRPLPWLARPVFPSLRRKAVCVIQITGLIVCLGPVVAPWIAVAVGGATLALLALSFGLDIAWLAHRRGLSTDHSGTSTPKTSRRRVEQ